MRFTEIIDEFIKNKTRCVVNGMPDDEHTKGSIIDRGEDFIKFEMLSKQEEKKTGKQRESREVIIIPIDKIETFGEGEKQTVSGGLVV